MKPYGVKKRDAGCCSGHDKYPSPQMKSQRLKHRALAQAVKERPRKKSARQIGKKLITNELATND